MNANKTPYLVLFVPSGGRVLWASKYYNFTVIFWATETIQWGGSLLISSSIALHKCYNFTVIFWATETIQCFGFVASPDEFCSIIIRILQLFSGRQKPSSAVGRCLSPAQSHCINIIILQSFFWATETIQGWGSLPISRWFLQCNYKNFTVIFWAIETIQCWGSLPISRSISLHKYYNFTIIFWPSETIQCWGS